MDFGVGELKFGEFNLEVSSPIAKVETEEANAASEYEKTTQVNSKTMMDKAVAEVTSDKDTTSTADTVLELQIWVLWSPLKPDRLCTLWPICCWTCEWLEN